MNIMCDRCPRRDTAYLLRALGDEAAATRIESEGCPWWWVVNMTNESGAVRQEEGCGVRFLPQFLTEYGARIAESTQSVQSTRNELVRGFAALLQAMPALIRTALPPPTDPAQGEPFTDVS